MELIKCDSTMLGGMPAKLNDIEFLQDGILDALKGLASSNQLGNTFILSGVLTSIDFLHNLHNTAGYAVVDGEICAVEAFGVGGGKDTTSGYIYLEKVITYNSAGFKVFKDTTSRDTYKVTKAQFKWYSTVQSGKVLWTDVKRIKNNWITLETVWQQSPAPSSPLERTRYRITPDNCLEIVFRLYNQPDLSGNVYPGTSVVVTTSAIPAAFRPDRDHRFALYCEDMTDSLISTHDGFLLFVLKTDGTIEFIPRASDSSATQTVNGASIWTGYIRVPLITT